MVTKSKTSLAGRKTILDQKLTLKIRELILDGQEYKTIQRNLGINPNSWDTWVYTDYQGFRDFLNETKKEVLLRKAECASDFILDMLQEIKTKKDTSTQMHALRLIQKESAFIRETLGKNLGYSRRQEVTGADGKNLEVVIRFHPPIASREQLASKRENALVAGTISAKDYIEAEVSEQMTERG